MRSEERHRGGRGGPGGRAGRSYMFRGGGNCGRGPGRGRGRGRGRLHGRRHCNGQRDRSYPHKKSAPSENTCLVCGVAEGRYKCPKCRTMYCSVVCCKEHKAKLCPHREQEQQSPTSEEKATNKEDGTNDKGDKKSKLANKKQKTRYLPSDTLLVDPLENSKRRRRMLNDEEDEQEEEEEEWGWRITEEMMNRLDKASWLQKELQDGGLRQILHEIDSADDGSANDNTQQSSSSWLGNIMGSRRDCAAGKWKSSVSQREVALETAKLSNPPVAKFLDRLLVTAGVLVRNPDAPLCAGDDNVDANQLEDEDLEKYILAPIPPRTFGMKHEDLLRRLQEEQNGDRDDDMEAVSDEEEEDDDSPRKNEKRRFQNHSEMRSDADSDNGEEQEEKEEATVDESDNDDSDSSDDDVDDGSNDNDDSDDENTTHNNYS